MIGRPLRSTTAAAIGILGAVAVLLITPLPRFFHGPLGSKILDFGHLPLFALLTMGLAWMLRGRWVAAWLVAVAEAGIGELVQDYFGRSGDWDDFLRGVIGAALGFLALWWYRQPRSIQRGAIAMTAAAVLMIWPIADAWDVVADSVDAYRSFPVLADFSTVRQGRRWTHTQSRLTIDPASPGHATLTFLPGTRPWSGTLFRPIVNDWQGYTNLVVVMEGVEPIDRLHLAVHDSRRDRGYKHRFNAEMPLTPGVHRLVFPLEAIRTAPTGRPTDLGMVQAIQIFMATPDQPVSIVLHSLELE